MKRKINQNEGLSGWQVAEKYNHFGEHKLHDELPDDYKKLVNTCIDYFLEIEEEARNETMTEKEFKKKYIKIMKDLAQKVQAYEGTEEEKLSMMNWVIFERMKKEGRV